MAAGRASATAAAGARMVGRVQPWRRRLGNDDLEVTHHKEHDEGDEAEGDAHDAGGARAIDPCLGLLLRANQRVLQLLRLLLRLGRLGCELFPLGGQRGLLLAEGGELGVLRLDDRLSIGLRLLGCGLQLLLRLLQGLLLLGSHPLQLHDNFVGGGGRWRRHLCFS